MSEGKFVLTEEDLSHIPVWKLISHLGGKDHFLAVFHLFLSLLQILPRKIPVDLSLSLPFPLLLLPLSSE